MQGRRPCNPAKGVPPFASPLRGLRAQDSATSDYVALKTIYPAIKVVAAYTLAMLQN